MCPVLPSASHDANKASLRTIEEQNAITGKIFWPESTGKATIPLANQVEAREQAAKSAQDRQARLKALSPADRRRAARHGIDRATRQAKSRGKSDPQRQNDPKTQPSAITRKEQRSARSKLPKDHLVNTGEAVDHYFLGKGEPRELSDAVKEKIKNHERITDWQMKRLEDGTADPKDPYVDINVRGKGQDVFHIGKTNATYTTKCEGPECTVKFKAPMFDKKGTKPDRFADPLGGGFEIPGGTPYPYEPFEWERKYKNPNWKKKKD